jgi:hypothetical protein
MPDLTIPDAVASDLEARLLSNPVTGVPLPADRIRKKSESGEIPSPRLVILCGDPRYVKNMHGTARIPVSLEYITSQDRVTAEDHEIAAGKIDAWWRALATSKRRAVIAEKIYLHDLILTQPSKSVRTEEREQVTAIRGDLVVTLVAV